MRLEEGGEIGGCGFEKSASFISGRVGYKYGARSFRWRVTNSFTLSVCAAGS